MIAVASVGLVALGSAVSSSVVSEPEATEQMQVAAIERPSFVSDLPSRTQQALQSGVIAPPVIPDRVEWAVDRPKSETLSVSSLQSESEEVVPEAPEDDLTLLRVVADGLNVRSGPSSESNKLFVLKQDEAVQVAEMNGNWARVTTTSGETGWAYQRYLAPAE
ncbi:MAG TPA: SH3 domain-containing protein [Devosiaceae bacterium]|jgi:hypothetical protein|nr:SH3 domain-containing protein [Devosiaceae bacterium]